MNPNSRRFLMALLVVLTYLGYRMIEVQLGRKAPFLPHCKRHEVASHQHEDDFIHHAESCSIEQSDNEDAKPGAQYLKISCTVPNLAQDQHQRPLKPSICGRSSVLHQRIPHLKKSQWNFRVPREAVNGFNLLLT